MLPSRQAVKFEIIHHFIFIAYTELEHLDTNTSNINNLAKFILWVGVVHPDYTTIQLATFTSISREKLQLLLFMSWLCKEEAAGQ